MRVVRLRDQRRQRRSAKTVAPARPLEGRDRDAAIERLRDEFDLLCLPPPCAWRIALHLGEN